MTEGPMYMTWFATGNNVALGADTARRVVPIRLESPLERPETRRDFLHPDLLGWVGENRPRLLAAVLTILRAYCLAGRPDQGLSALGSFEGWSKLVRAAVVWLGLPDPGETRMLLQDRADTEAEGMAVLLECLEKLDPDRQGKTAAEIVDWCSRPPVPPQTFHADLKDAVESLAGRLDVRTLGYRLRAFRRRVFQGRYLDHVSHGQGTCRWAVFPAQTFRDRLETSPPSPPSPPVAGGDGGDGGDVSPQAGFCSDGDGHGDAWEPPRTECGAHADSEPE
jgi:hypothetical protein